MPFASSFSFSPVYYGVDNSVSSLAPYIAQTFKWQDYVNWQKKLNEALAALNMNTTGMNTEGKPPESKCKSFFRRETEDDKENESVDSIEREEAVKYSGSKVYLK
ncbi:hypothetical protein V6N13_114390 [Hibiscus sabdariffa]|uniref:Retrotransposon Copia-like N-terminal domain-containing protein n=1 Tax=Hibiscus sabdariffa TaxID=183260 RepID=A0ABR2U1N1_9ROSI